MSLFKALGLTYILLMASAHSLYSAAAAKVPVWVSSLLAWSSMLSLNAAAASSLASSKAATG